ncbi:DUF927 domain-containing protein [Burkholderia stagnalis]|uniref:DUF927 domain-containing protein n=1 Tax=Burkholderia stagnalis TaxID=1503054 RepID=UPI000F5CB24D|nr:DUF927 domain-containing protein [Burkholderia stagnalis]RQY25354.1 DUF927 domain-containing protein [Burkholderia stagnalis]RQZ01495.1 DUF927 domain-containing protein [Burkholderia stagnalis]RQZ07072.1 DUF927 domain-containing protein [Burkholderia stagnalis]
MSAIPEFDERQRIENALACIPPDVEREHWWRIAAALKHELGDAGFDLFDGWSRGAANYSKADARDTWRSLRADGGVTVGTLFAIAKDHGFTIADRTAPVVDAAEIARRRAERQAKADQAEADRVLEQRKAATLAVAVWAKASPVRDDHPYLARKGLPATPMLREIDAGTLRGLIGYTPRARGELLVGRILVAPIQRAGNVSSLEFIDADGRKSALAGGAKAGRYWLAAEPAGGEQRVAIAEGVASALTHQIVCPADVAVAALTAGNLHQVARAMRDAHPEAVILIHGEVGNGADKALDAARAAAGVLAVPMFEPDELIGDAAPSDINDLFVLRSADAVRACIDAAAAPATADTGATAGAGPDDSASFPLLDERPCWRVYDSWTLVSGNRMKPGVYWHGVKLPKGDAPPELIDKWVCSPLWVIATTRNREDAEYGRLLEVLSPAGKRKKWAMPMAMLAGDGNEVRSVLLSEGLVFDMNDRQAVPRYIAGQHPKRTMRAASVTGWHDDAFVLPEVVIGADDIWFQASGRVAPYASAGTFDGWCELAALASGNPLLMLSMSAALAGPLLGPLNVDGGGAHLYGDSSCGKTTALVAAVSVWGGAAFKRTWRATANGLEGAGSLHSDTLLALDELGEIEPRALYESAYALINGTGKTRANRHGEARQAARWRVFLLSTGELTIAARMGAGGIEAKAGQELRILDVPVTGAYGLFDDLHGRDSGGLLSDDVRNLASKHYGHAGPRFLEALVRELRAGFRPADALQPLIERFDAAEGQERRAARTFALCALAGEMAVVWDIVPWVSDEPTRAAVHAFNLWRGRRQGSGHGAEHAAILRAVSDFIDRHADSRFSNIEGSADLIRDRAGYWKNDGERRLYLFTSGGLREATKGYDLPRVTAALDKAGALADVDGGGKRSKTTRTSDGRTPRLYHVDPERLTEGE